MRDIESVKTEKFKFELDKFLELISDQPKMPNYVTASGSNRILDQLTHLRAQGIYQSGGVPDSAMEQSWLLRSHSKYPSKLDKIPIHDWVYFEYTVTKNMEVCNLDSYARDLIN